nr:hypothetical protein [Tanacetum cinerariifolium]
MEQYITFTDHALWEVIVNGDSVSLVASASAEGCNVLREAMKNRFGGNKESKKMQKTIPKQNYKNFAASSQEGLDKTYGRFQKLIRQLEIHDKELPIRLHKEEKTKLERMQRDRYAQEEASNAALTTEFDDVQARMDTGALLAPKLQEEEREQFSIDEQARFLVEIIAKKKRFFAVQKAEQIRKKPPTKAQLRNKMITYLKNIGSFTYNQLKNKSLEEIQKLYERGQKWINDFVLMNSKVVKDNGKKVDSSQKLAESTTKRPRAEHDEESVKKQILEDDTEKEELRACLDIVPGDDFGINVIVNGDSVSSVTSASAEGKETVEEGLDVGVILVTPDEKMHSYAICLKFHAFNHVMDYEALLAGLAASTNHGMKDLHVFIDSLTLVTQEVSVGIKTRPSVEETSSSKKGKAASNAPRAEPNYNREASGSWNFSIRKYQWVSKQDHRWKRQAAARREKQQAMLQGQNQITIVKLVGVTE